MVELLSSCPTNWGMSAADSLKWVEEHMVPVYPLGDYKIHAAISGDGAGED
jgi:2-oxoglutarate ferredoxin oxidoreductase subunit beta